MIRYKDLPGQFKNVLQSLEDRRTVEEPWGVTARWQPIGRRSPVVNRVGALGDVAADISSLSAAELASVDIAYLNGELAVAENGCVWLYESQMGNRLLPFICQHLVLVIREQDIVATMHDAYNIVAQQKKALVFFGGAL